MRELKTENSSLDKVRKPSLEQTRTFGQAGEGFTLSELSSDCLVFNPLSDKMTEDVWVKKLDFFQQPQSHQESWLKGTETSTEWVELWVILD